MKLTLRGLNKMIFSKFLTPAYKSSDAQKRLASIDKLNPNKEKEKSILHELAFNDENEKVTVAALHKLDSFVLWMKSLETSSSTLVKKHAQTVCQNSLEDSEMVNDELFEAFVLETKNKGFLETLLFSNPRLLNNAELSTKTLFRLDNERVNKRFFSEHASSEQKALIVDSVEDQKLLQWFAKQKNDVNTAQKLQEKLEYFEWKKQQPIKIKQKATLINSRLLSLKEYKDYASIKAELRSLTEEFEAIKNEFVHLDELSAASFTEKFLALKVSVQQKLESLELDYKKHINAKKIDDDLADIQSRIAQIRQQLDLTIDSKQEEVDSHIKIFDTGLAAAADELESIKSESLSRSQTIHLTRIEDEIQQCKKAITNIDKLRLCAKKSSDLVDEADKLRDKYTDVSTLSVNEYELLEASLAELKVEIDKIKQETGLSMPSQYYQKYQDTIKQLKKTQQEANAKFKQALKKAESKLRVVNHQIKDGKLKPAIATFQTAKRLLSDLPEKLRLRVDKLYTQVEEEVAKLQDWQAYVAQPRKPLLLEEAANLAQSPMTDGHARAEEVKTLRAQWNSYGDLQTEQDEKLNKAFDLALEKAFEPCRQFFAALDESRATNLKEAEQLINQINIFVEEHSIADTTEKSLSSYISSVRKQFNQIGDIEKSKYKTLKRRFSQAIRPLQTLLEEKYSNNAELKQGLVNKAIQLKTLDDLSDAANKAKNLQLKWKQIGFAGKPKEDVLWLEFRKHNDEIFSRYHEKLQAKQSQQDAALMEIETKISTLHEKLDSATTSEELAFFDASAQELSLETEKLDAVILRSVKQKLSSLKQAYEKQSEAFRAMAKQQSLSDLFTFLRSYTNDEHIEKLSELPKKYQSWFNSTKQLSPALMQYSRDELLMIIELQFSGEFTYAQTDSKARKKEIQLELMAANLEGRTEFNFEELFIAWISKGKLAEHDINNLTTLESVCASKLN